jgi:hypothetical protein
MIRIRREVINRQVDKEMRRLCKLERTCARSRRRFAFHEYLEAVIDYCWKLEESGHLRKVSRHIARRYGNRYRRKDPIQIIIAATSNADVKVRSRWSRGTRRAYNWRGWWKGRMTLGEFLRINGGITQCAYKIAKHRIHRERRGPCQDWD